LKRKKKKKKKKKEKKKKKKVEAAQLKHSLDYSLVCS
jgi:hypothetical protein